MKKSSFRYVVYSFGLLFALAPLAHAAIAERTEADNVLDVSVTATEPVKIERTESDTRSAEDDNDGLEGDENEKSEHATGTLRALEKAGENAEEGLRNAVLHVDGDLSRSRDKDADDDGDIEDAEEVHSSADLKSFIAHKIRDDARLKSVNIDNGKVEVEYDADAKLFGFMKTTVTARVSADKEGKVEVKYPWYHIFVKKQNTSTSLKSMIARAIAAERKAEKENVATTTVRADIVAAFGVPNLFEIIADTLDGATEDK